VLSAATGAIIRYDGTFDTLPKTALGLIDGSITYCDVDNEDNLWVGFYGGLSKIDGTSVTNYTTIDGLTSENVFYINHDDDGTVYIGYYFDDQMGYSTIKDGVWNHISTPTIPAINVIRIASGKDGDVWIGTIGKGEMAQGILKLTSSGYTQYSEIDGLSENGIRDILYDKESDRLWVATRDGLSRYEGGEWTTLGTEDGFVSDNISSIAMHPNGNIWVGTTKGVCEVDLSDVTSYLQPEIINLNAFVKDKTLVLKSESQVLDVQVLDLNGSLVHSVDEYTQEIDLKNQPNGMYVIKAKINGDFHLAKIYLY
jgi:ligand-binding sensor domain-containing protein